ncbi:hypothetical protein ABH309_01320, partial [Chromobacterium piscinae]
MSKISSRRELAPGRFGQAETGLRDVAVAERHPGPFRGRQAAVIHRLGQPAGRLLRRIAAHQRRNLASRVAAQQPGQQLPSQPAGD